jgi:hypothetical protein
MLRASLAAALVALVAAASAQAANPTSLLLPQSTAFSILGRSCGGIQEQSYATGFAPDTGRPQGDVHLQTRCGGSGRGGGYKTTTYVAWAAVTWDFGGAAVSATKLAAAPTGLDPNLSVYDAHGDHLYNSLGQAYLEVVLPAAPTGVSAVESAGLWHVAWTPDPTAAPLITSSTITFTPVNSTASPITALVSGDATSADAGPLAPLTAYDVTVVSNAAAGPSPASAPVRITTPASTVPPSAPVSVAAGWIGANTLRVTWQPGASGDSPIDRYQVAAADPDTGTRVKQSVPASSLSATLSISDIPDWTIQVRAHNVAGWGRWSAKVLVDGL